jgi:hypothetical protein
MIHKHHPYIKFVEKETNTIKSVIRIIKISPNVLNDSFTMVYSDKPEGVDYFNEVIYKSGEYYLVFSGAGGNYVMDLYYPCESYSKAELLIKSLKKKNL